MDDLFTVSCTRCKADEGKPCRNKRGNILAPSLTHKARVVASMAGKLPRKPLVAEVYSIDTREERIQQVLFGIKFAREFMKLPDAEIDRNLAEMIVDRNIDIM